MAWRLIGKTALEKIIGKGRSGSRKTQGRGQAAGEKDMNRSEDVICG